MSEARSETVMALIARLENGDAQVVENLLQKYRPYLKLVAQRAVGQMFRTKFDASDIVQKTCFDAFNSISKFRGENSAEFSSWISTILHRNLATQVRNHTAKKRDVRRELPLVNPTGDASLTWYTPQQRGNGPESVIIKGELALLLADAMSHLDDKQRTAVHMRFLDGCKLAEISAEMELPTHSVARLIANGIDVLRRNLPHELRDLY